MNRHFSHIVYVFIRKFFVKRQVPVNKTPTLGLDPGHDFQNSVINLHVHKPMPVEKIVIFFYQFNVRQNLKYLIGITFPPTDQGNIQ